MNAQRQELEHLLAEEETLLSELERRAEKPVEPPSLLDRAGAGMDWADDKVTGALKWQIERGGKAAMALPGQVADTARHLAQTTGTHYRTLAHGVGLPVDPPSEQASQQYRQDVMDAGLTIAGGAIGRFLGKGVTEFAKRIGRGFRTRAGAGRVLSQNPSQVVSSGAPTATPMAELSTPAVTAGGTALGVDLLDPTPWEFTDKPVAGGAGVAAGFMAWREGTENLLLQNPRWRNLVTRGTASAPLATAIGGVLGYLLSKGVQLGAEGVDDVVRFVTEDELEQPPARGEAMMGPVPGSSPGTSAAAPVDPQALLAQRLMATPPQTTRNRL